MKNRFTPSAERSLEKALELAREMGHTYIGTEHILLGILFEKECIAAKLLTAHGITFSKTKELIAAYEGVGKESSVSSSDMSPKARKIIEASAFSALRKNNGVIGTEYLLSAMLNEPDCVAVRLIKAQNVRCADIFGDMISFENGIADLPSKNNSQKLPPFIQKYGVDLTSVTEAKSIDPVLCRDKEIECLIKILLRRTKNNPCLIGDPGVGKTAIAEGLAARILEGNVPYPLASKKIIALDLPLMLAGAKYRGEFEERMKNIIDEASSNPDIILFIDELHTIVGAGSAEGSIDAANMIKPALARSKIKVIGATTAEEYRKFIEKDTALERRFQPLLIKEPSESEAVTILKGLKNKFELHHKLTISDEAIIASVNLSVKYVTDRFLPDKAIDLLDEAASEKRLNHEYNKKLLNSSAFANTLLNEKERLLSQGKAEEAKAYFLKESESVSNQLYLMNNEEKPTLSSEDVARTLSERIGTPILKNTYKLLSSINLKEKLMSRVFGQENAISSTVNTITRCNLGFNDEIKPIGSFIFLGPSGVGKTELCKALAKELFGSERELIKLDMSEYSEKHSIAKLIGSPPGYVGYGETGALIGKIKTHPRCILLFDEIEKAHPDIYSLLLQILDDGYITDSYGKKCNLRNTVIILTSNIGSEIMEESSLGIGFSNDSYTNKILRVKESATKFFRSEFIGRFDDIIVFNPLSEEALLNITKKDTEDFIAKAASIGVDISFADDIPHFIAQNSHSLKFGARQVKHYFREKIETPFLNLISQNGLENIQSFTCKLSENNIIWTSVTKESVSHII